MLKTLVIFSCVALAACASAPSRYLEDPVKSPLDYALISTLSDIPGATVLAVDGEKLQTFSRASPFYFYIVPGAHALTVTFETPPDLMWGFKYATATINVTVSAGHTYFPHYEIVTVNNEKKAYFSLADRGVSFPKQCLPRSLITANNGQTWTEADMLLCEKRSAKN